MLSLRTLMKIEGSGDCTCGHRWNRHRYWREDGYNSGACDSMLGKCPCLIYHDVDWPEDEPEEEETVEVTEEDWDLI
jgi:hypothetical protein